MATSPPALSSASPASAFAATIPARQGAGAAAAAVTVAAPAGAAASAAVASGSPRDDLRHRRGA